MSIGPFIYMFGTLNNLCTLCVLLYHALSLILFYASPRYLGPFYIVMAPFAHGAIFLLLFYTATDVCHGGGEGGDNLPHLVSDLPISGHIARTDHQQQQQQQQQPVAHAQPAGYPLLEDYGPELHPLRVAVHSAVQAIVTPYFIAVGTVVFAYMRRTLTGIVIYEQKIQSHMFNRWLYRALCCSTALAIVSIWLWYPYLSACWDLRKYSPPKQLLKNHVSLREWFGRHCVDNWSRLIFVSLCSGILHSLWNSF
ncbi:hypothetical protein EV182_006239, partial [Spiromyces aspiralis]